MATSHEVMCVNKTSSHDRPTHLSHLGGQTPQGRGWRVTVAEAIKGVLAGKWRFFAIIDGEQRSLVVAVDRDGSKYLKLEESEDTHALMNLPPCSTGHSTHPETV
jgi:hypothetical protein